MRYIIRFWFVYSDALVIEVYQKDESDRRIKVATDLSHLGCSLMNGVVHVVGVEVDL